MNKKNANTWEIVAEELAGEILSGKYKETPLPGEYPLCQRFDCSRTSIRRAMVDLEKRGLIYRRHGKGTFAFPVERMNLAPVGLLVREPEKLSGDYFVELIRGCNSYLHTIGSQLVIISQRPEEWSERLSTSLSGVVVIPAKISQSDIDVLARRKVPYVIMSESKLKGPIVNMDVEKISHDLACALLEKGHRRIALISGHDEHSDGFKRNGIFFAMKEYGIDIEQVQDFRTNYDPSLAREAAAELIGQKKRPTAIIAFDDALALETIKVAKEAGLKLPRQLSVVGYNNFPFGSLVEPALSTVHFPIHDAGRAAARMIAGQRLKNIPIKTIIQYPHLVLRKSIAALRTKRQQKD